MTNICKILKVKFYNSIRGLTLAEASAKPRKLINSRNVNYDAGADMLHHFQIEWNNMHELAEENAQKGQEADALIATVYEKMEIQWNNIAILNNTLTSIPKINSDLQSLMDQIGKRCIELHCNTFIEKQLLGVDGKIIKFLFVRFITRNV